VVSYCADQSALPVATPTALSAPSINVAESVPAAGAGFYYSPLATSSESQVPVVATNVPGTSLPSLPVILSPPALLDRIIGY